MRTHATCSTCAARCDQRSAHCWGIVWPVMTVPYDHHDPHLCEGHRADVPERQPRPWTPERRERAGRAAWEEDTKHNYPWIAMGWDALKEHQRETYRVMGEAAVRADEEGRWLLRTCREVGS